MANPEPLGYSPVAPTDPTAAGTQSLRRRRVRLIGFAVVLGVLLAGVSVGGTLLVLAHQRDGATPQTSRSPVDLTFTGDLRSALLPLPAGAVELTSKLYVDHSVSVAQAAADFTKDPAGGQRYLESLGYVQGATKAWRDGHGNEVWIFLFQYSSDGSAGTRLLDIDRAERTNVNLDGQVPFVTMNGKYYIYNPSANKMGYVRAVVQQEAVFASIGVYSPGKADTALALQLAEQQYARLPALGVLPTHP
jgi:hypothetical protein